MLRQTFLLLVGTLAIVKSDENYRLNSKLKPSSYALTITPYFDTGDKNAFTYDGEVIILLNTNETDVREIKLHSQDLEFTEVEVYKISDNVPVSLKTENPFSFDDFYLFAYIYLETALEANTDYALIIKYKGPIRSDNLGFYRSYYVQDGVKKWHGATQMEPTHARKVFPCFDEPAFKASFNLTIDRPAGYKRSLSNTKLLLSAQLPNGYVRDVFNPTPIMSTYLVAFLISEFEAAEYTTNKAQEFGVFTRPDATNQTSFAFEFGKQVVAEFSEYFGIDYYSVDSNLKLDHVAVPDFRAGAMENWGLIMYKENLLLYVPEETTVNYEYSIASTISHETAHMWFGNLVTCHWWTNIWLNEGFASYFQDYFTSLVKPVLGASNIVVTDSLYTAYLADQTPDAAAITNYNVFSPAQISGHFGAISYQKAGSIIRMMHHLIGDDAFKYGLNLYLTKNKFGNTHPEDLYNALQEGAALKNSLSAYPDASIARIMGSWVSQAGHPLLQVDIDYSTGTVSLTQKRYYVNASFSSEETYQIPITFATSAEPDFENTKPAFIMEDQSSNFKIQNIDDNQSWVVFNVQETGFYKVNYDAQSWTRIATALNQLSTIHNLNRAKIVNDLFALYNADVVEFSLLVEVMLFLQKEVDYSVWYAAVTNLETLTNKYFSSEAMDLINTYSLNLITNAVEQVGYHINETDDFVVKRNRLQILEFACKLGHRGCVQYTGGLFKELRISGTAVAPSLRPPVYCNGLRYGNADDFDFLWQKLLTTNVATEASDILIALGCTKVEEKLKEYLEIVKQADSPIRLHDITVPVTSILNDHNNADLVVQFLQEDYIQLATIYPTISTVVNNIIASLHTSDQFDQFESWLVSCSDCTDDVKTSAEVSLNAGRATLAWVNSHSENLTADLKKFFATAV